MTRKRQRSVLNHMRRLTHCLLLSISEGYEADMMLVPSNPLEDLSALQDILLVMSNGRIAMKRIPFAKK